jgi:hypothetical protein
MSKFLFFFQLGFDLIPIIPSGLFAHVVTPLTQTPRGSDTRDRDIIFVHLLLSSAYSIKRTGGNTIIINGDRDASRTLQM